MSPVIDVADTNASVAHADRPLIEVDGVAKDYLTPGGDQVHALDPVHLDIGAGEIISLVGPSGCGKSTLLNIVAGLLEPTAGSLRVDGVEQREPHPDIGFMFQSPVLLPWRTVKANVQLPAQVGGLDLRALDARIDDVLERVGLGDFKHAYPRHLSGGMQQRVSLARVLTYEPRVLLMDEPFGALDEFTREAMNLELNTIARSTGITVVFVTHSISEAVFMADRVVVMSPRPGRVTGVIPTGFGERREIELMHSPEFVDLMFTVRERLRS